MTRAAADPSLRPIWPGTAGPSSGTPARQVPSVRRTTVIDILFPEPGMLTLRGAGRDLLTLADAAHVIGAASTHVEIDLLTRRVVGLEADPEPAGPIAALVGVSTGSQFRRVLAECAPDELAKGSLLAQLLDDTPVAALVAGSSLGRQGLIAREPGVKYMPITDICAGWQAGGLMIRAVEEDDVPYMGEGPLAPPLEDPSDPFGWPTLAVLPVGSMRRRRRLDIGPSTKPDTAFAFDVVFRDSYIEPDGRESAVHEYGVVGHIGDDGRVRDIAATPRVLPSPQCPAAAASAQRLVGVALSDIRTLVGAEFTGTSTCTHLNDVCRSIGGLAGALSVLRATDR